MEEKLKGQTDEHNIYAHSCIIYIYDIAHMDNKHRLTAYVENYIVSLAYFIIRMGMLWS